MTGISKNFINSPRYQRMIQKFSSLRPEQKAILDTAIVDSAFADQAMKRDLQSMRTAAEIQNRKNLLENRQGALDLDKQAFGIRTSLKKDIRDFQNEQDKWGTGIAVANLPMAGYFGYKGLQANQAEAAENKRMRDWVISQGG